MDLIARVDPIHSAHNHSAKQRKPTKAGPISPLAQISTVPLKSKPLSMHQRPPPVPKSAIPHRGNNGRSHNGHNGLLDSGHNKGNHQNPKATHHNVNGHNHNHNHNHHNHNHNGHQSHANSHAHGNGYGHMNGHQSHHHQNGKSPSRRSSKLSSWYAAGTGFIINGTAVTKELDGSATAYGIECVSSGRHRWNLKCHQQSDRRLEVIGISSNVENLERPFQMQKNGYHYAYSFKWGRKCFNGEWTDYAAKLAEGDEISVELDLNAGTLSFYKNGRGLGVAFRNIPGGQQFRLAFWSHYKYSKIRRLSYEDLTTKEQRKRIQKQERLALEHGQMKRVPVRTQQHQSQSLQAQISELLDEVKDHENQMKSARKKQKEYKLTIQQLKAQIEEMKNEKKEIDRDRAKLLSQVAELQQTESAQKNTIISMEMNHKEKDLTHDEELENLQSEIKYQIQENALLKERLQRSYTLEKVRELGVKEKKAAADSARGLCGVPESGEILFLYQYHARQEEENNREKSPDSVKPSSHAGDSELYEKHRFIVGQWNVLTTQLEEFKCPGEHEDDEKGQMKLINRDSPDNVLEKYLESRALMLQQQDRLRQVNDEYHLKELVAQQNRLSKLARDLEADVTSKTKVFEDKEKRYLALKEQRNVIVASIQSVVDTCNEVVVMENEAVSALEDAGRTLAMAQQQLSLTKESRSECVSTIHLYGHFSDANRAHIERLHTKFSELWNGFEAVCTKWTEHDLCIWFKYQTAEIQVKVDWDDVETRLVKRNVRGKHLCHFGERMFRFVGVDSPKVIRHLVSAIQKIVKHYNANFVKLWSEYESKWLTWTEEDITHWFQYQTMPLEAGTVDWVKTCELLKAQNVNGRALTQFTTLMFSFIAIEDPEIVKHLVSAIEMMLDKFGAKIKSSRTVNIPREYVCPITNEIMRDPVLAFDGNTYERSAIQSYLKRHNKSPITGAPAEHTMVFANKTFRSVIEKFLSTNNVDVEVKSADEEEEPEIGYI